jgi:hypothetical protein
MAMFNVLFDASGAPDDCDAVVVGGFVATAQQWVEFDRNWNDALADYGVSRLHMKEYAHSVGEYETWRGDHRKRMLFLERLISIIKTRVRHCFVNAVIMDGYRAVDAKYCLSERHKPIALAGIACVDKVKRWAAKWNIDQKGIAYIFEDGDKDKGSLTRSVEQHHGFIPIYVKKEASRALEAADLLAYEHLLANRKIYKSGFGTLGLSDLRRSLQALDEIPHGKDGEDWGVYDLESLTVHCVENKYPMRSSMVGR